jgi:hypothetical protein
VVVYGLPVVLLALDMGLVRWWRRVPVGVETTRVTVVNGEGYPDYLGWINDKYGAGVTRENNAAVGLLEVTGYAGDPAVLRAMGMGEARPKKLLGVSAADYLWKRGVKLSSLGDLRAFQQEERALLSKPWKADAHPMWAAWVDTQAPALAVLHEAAKRERFYVPVITADGRLRGAGPGALEETDSGYFNALWSNQATIRDALLLRAQMEAGRGDWIGFRADVMDLLNLARLLGTGWSQAESYVEDQWEADAMRAVGGATETMPLEEAAWWVKALEGVGKTGDTARSFNEFLRFRDLDRLAKMARQGLAEHPDWSEESWPWFVTDSRVGPVVRMLWPVNYASYARDVNGWYDAAGPAGVTVSPEVKEWAQGDPRAVSWLHWPAVVFRTELSLSEWHGNSFGIGLWTETYRAIGRAALGLRVYRLVHGMYPADLKELVPEVMAGVPQDPCGKGALRYRREGSGYVVYSVAFNGTDDNGEMSATEGPLALDVGVRVGE